MISRRLLITGFAAAAASTIAPAVMAAGDGGFGDFLGGLADAASRRYAEKYRDDARWDGKYYYDKYDNRRYSRSEWQREIQRRARAEEEGRDWRDSKRRAWEEKRYGKDYRKFKKEQRRDERRDVKEKRREEERERKERERACARTQNAYAVTMKEFAVKMNAVVKKNVAVTTANPVIPD